MFSKSPKTLDFMVAIQLKSAHSLSKHYLCLYGLTMSPKQILCVVSHGYGIVSALKGKLHSLL